MVPPRRRVLSVVGSTALLGVAGCLGDLAGPPGTEETTAADTESCSAAEPPHPDTGDGLPDPRDYPDGPPEFTATAVGEFVEAYERAYEYNAMLAGFESDGNCVTYLELYVVGDETSVAETDSGFTVDVTTRGSYTGTTCGTETGTETSTPLPHVDLPPTSTRYRVRDRTLVREGTDVACW